MASEGGSSPSKLEARVFNAKVAGAHIAVASVQNYPVQKNYELPDAALANVVSQPVQRPALQQGKQVGVLVESNR